MECNDIFVLDDRFASSIVDVVAVPDVNCVATLIVSVVGIPRYGLHVLR